jgi:hypothetical protein
MMDHLQKKVPTVSLNFLFTLVEFYYWPYPRRMETSEEWLCW